MPNITPNTPEISKIQLPNGNVYYLKDDYARQVISSLSQPVKYLGITTTEISDGSTITSVVIGDRTVTAEEGNFVIYGEQEFIFNGTKWQELGSASVGLLKAFAYVDTGIASYTPEGAINVSVAEGTDYTPAGTVSIESINGDISSETVKVINEQGTYPTFTPSDLEMTVSNETLSFDWTKGSFSEGTLPTYTNKSVVTSVSNLQASGVNFSGTSVGLSATFTGTPATITVNPNT